jgi:hypothetical protein
VKQVRPAAETAADWNLTEGLQGETDCLWLWWERPVRDPTSAALQDLRMVSYGFII